MRVVPAPQKKLGAGAWVQVLRGKGPYPVAEYRLAAEISAAAAAQAAAAAAGAAGGGTSYFTDDWYQPLLAAAAASGGSDLGGRCGSEARGVYSFCMCPGGQIVPTSTSEEELCINGMSFSRCPPACPLVPNACSCLPFVLPACQPACLPAFPAGLLPPRRLPHVHLLHSLPPAGPVSAQAGLEMGKQRAGGGGAARRLAAPGGAARAAGRHGAAAAGAVVAGVVHRGSTAAERAAARVGGAVHQAGRQRAPPPHMPAPHTATTAHTCTQTSIIPSHIQPLPCAAV